MSRHEGGEITKRCGVVPEPVGLARVQLRICECKRSNVCHIVHVDPAETSVLNERVNDAVPGCSFRRAVAQEVLHKGLRPKVSEGEAFPLDVPFDELVPRPMGDGGVIAPARAQVNDVLYACSGGVVENGLALTQHIDGVSGKQEQSVDALERGRAGGSTRHQGRGEP